MVVPSMLSLQTWDVVSSGVDGRPSVLATLATIVVVLATIVLMVVISRWDLRL
jgi:hypothetical protein